MKVQLNLNLSLKNSASCQLIFDKYDYLETFNQKVVGKLSARLEVLFPIKLLEISHRH